MITSIVTTIRIAAFSWLYGLLIRQKPILGLDYKLQGPSSEHLVHKHAI